MVLSICGPFIFVLLALILLVLAKLVAFLLICSLLAIPNAATVRLFRRRQAGAGWWSALAMGWLTGAALGVWSGFFFEYQPSPDVRVAGAPVPTAFFHWEGPPGEEQWIDFITPAPVLFAGSNIFLLALTAGCPVGLVYWLALRRKSRLAFPTA
jgi:hypothetical protein